MASLRPTGSVQLIWHSVFADQIMTVAVGSGDGGLPGGSARQALECCSLHTTLSEFRVDAKL